LPLDKNTIVAYNIDNATSVSEERFVTITEKITNYIDGLIAAGKLHPGDRLPGYVEICEQFSIPYSSAQRAFKNMEYAGKIKIIHGVGSFLNGGDELNVDLYLTATTFDLAEMEKLVNDISKAGNLHLNIRVLDIKSPDFRTETEEHKIVIAEKDPWMKTSGSLLDFTMFPDLEDFLAQNNIPSGKCAATELPFYLFTYQGAVNMRLLKKLGLPEFSEISSLDWWDPVAEQCRRHGAFPACFTTIPENLWGFPSTHMALLMMLSGRKNVSALFDEPFFGTERGKRMFEIFAGFKHNSGWTNFFLQQDVLLNFMLGSWGAVQYKKFGCELEDFRFVPMMADGRRILQYMPTFLQVYANNTVTDNEKERIWKFLNVLLSKKIMKRIVGESGALSFRKDMIPDDYSWMTRDDFRAFYPRRDDLLLPTEYLSREKSAVLTALFQAYMDCGADSGKIRKLMDQKISIK